MIYKRVVLTRVHYPWHQTTPPLGLGYLASYLDAHTSASVRLIDGHLLRLQPLALAELITSHCPDLVGITCLTADYPHVVKLSQHLKKMGCAVVIGGVHPTFMPQETLEDSGADYVVVGEGEIPLQHLVEGRDWAKGIVSLKDRGDSSEVSPEFSEVVEDLDSLPAPAWHLMPPSNYPRAAHGGLTRGSPIGIVVTSRGCPYNCSFCSSPQISGRRIRYHSPDNVVEQIRTLVECYGVKEIQFEDDNLTLSRKHIEGICRGLLFHGLHRIPWSCPNGIRADKVDLPLLKLMKKAGCYYTAFGIESADQGILNMVDKGESIQRIEQAIDDAESVGIRTQGFFIFGLPGETKSTMEKTLQWAVKSKLTRAQFLVLDVLPGSRLWTELKGKFTPNWGKESYSEAEWAPEGLSRADIKDGQTRAMRRFYMSPRRAWYLIRMIRFGHIGQLIARLKRFAV